ncbi:MAG: hypothetical protein JXA92_14400 [candidate division Zixibacteria bacterium]|nr:hypothetical protein [candidate division Zixibacteria bacterium]
MFRTYRTLFIFAFIVLGVYLIYNYMFGSSSSSLGPPDPDSYISEQMGFSIKFPDGWLLDQYDKGEVVVFQNYGLEVDNDLFMVAAFDPRNNEQDNRFSYVSVTVREMPYNMKLDYVFDGVVSWMKTDFNYFEENNRGKTKINGRDAFWIDFMHKDEGILFRSRGYCLVKDSRAYLVICNADPVNYSALVNTFVMAANSIRIS